MKGDKQGRVTIETGMFRKEAAADMYILESSAQKERGTRVGVKGRTVYR